MNGKQQLESKNFPFKKVLIVQGDLRSAELLSEFFLQRGADVYRFQSIKKARNEIDTFSPDLVLIDLHLPSDEWVDFIGEIRKRFPHARFVMTNRYPDFNQELLAKNLGIEVFLRAPFTEFWIEQALERLQALDTFKKPGASWRSRVRVPVSVKITLPYMLLALLVAMAASYVVSRWLFETVEERFRNQLAEAGKVAVEVFVDIEDQRLEVLRLLANTEGVADAIQAHDAEKLRTIALPIAVNYGEEIIEILDAQAVSVLSLRHQGQNPENYVFSQGSDIYAEWPFVQKVLRRQADEIGDKFAGVVQLPFGSYFYVAGPVYDNRGELVGVLLVGRSVQTLASELSSVALARVSLYDVDGNVLGTTLPRAFPLSSDLITVVLNRQQVESPVRTFEVFDLRYSEVLAPWEARGGEDIGVIGASLAQNFLVRATRTTRINIFLLITLAFLLIIIVGVYLANRITTPLMEIVDASDEVAQGNLDVRVIPRGNDEIAVLAESFNYMVASLREGAIYRDLLGRTVSPEVREQLRMQLSQGNLKLEGQKTVATVLMTDIRGFTTISEQTNPETIFHWLNEYFGRIVPIVTTLQGVVSRFDGDAMLTFFGILPRPLPPEQSAYYACVAAVRLIQTITAFNAERLSQGLPPFVTGIGVNTGEVTVGGVGAADRLQFTLIGDTVNTAQRLESFTRIFGETSAVVSEYTYEALGEYRSYFQFEFLGEHLLKGKTRPIRIYRLLPVFDGDIQFSTVDAERSK
ncbi:adenylate cyclase [Ardenticatena maritima]|uniref:Adenylate cyclase n=1 Tax=Ardenticatena maritima TaxID=872965 RepID=A0A0M9UBE6_9CHLR|nr:adenylate/guanylate cyclase domain-containing protein [Ardenticatena maritima]KPL87617.1 hypothetical protein SE16_08295 [Ardenticatena maritima]GAP61680.1 adenylate cyclase [Ardenticatena maritima]